VRASIARTAQQGGRAPDAVTLVVVSKRVPVSVIREALGAGQRDLGENYAQELRDKARELADRPDVRWHFIGPLQRNKVKYVVGTAVLLHAVDDAAILAEIERQAVLKGVSVEVLVQVNLAGEAQKAGVSEAGLRPLLERFAGTPHVACRGLMLMPPYDPDPEATRPLFRRLREVRDALRTEPLANVTLDELSMGMSHDHEAAVEEGATLVRVGTAIFGERG
jgi:hypothetical protein